MIFLPSHEIQVCVFKAGALVLAVLLLGCGKEEIKVYRVAKEKPETPDLANPHGDISKGGRRATASGESAPLKPAWIVPASWTEELPSQMSLAKFSATNEDARAQVTVSAFPGGVGGLLANVNRWRGQVGLPPIGETELPNAVARLETQAGNASLVDLIGADANAGHKTRLICVVLPHGEQTWFFKIMGDEQVVAREKDTFLKFVQTAKFSDAP